MKITIEIEADEYARLRAKAALAGVCIRDILSQFVADATGSDRSGGSDERDLARNWLERSYNLTPDYDAEDTDRESKLRCQRAVRWQIAACAIQEREEICQSK